MSDAAFPYDVFLSHSAKDKAVVRPLAERLRQDGRQGKAEGRRQKAEVGIHPSSFILSFARSARTGRSWRRARSGFATR